MRLDDGSRTKDVEVFIEPSSITSLNGRQFDSTGQVWSYQDGTTTVYLDFNQLVGLSESLKTSVRRLMIWVVENRAPDTCLVGFRSLCWFFKVIHGNRKAEIVEVTQNDLLFARAHKPSKTAEKALRTYRPLLIRWAELGYVGITEGAVKLLREMRQVSEQIGEAVLTMNPISGPYSDMERETIFDALSFGYSQQLMSQQQYVIAWLSALFGQRPCQYAMLKLKDLEVVIEGTSTRYFLQIPLAKASGEQPRTEFNRVELREEFFELLNDWKAKVMADFSEILPNVEEAPFFPGRSKRRTENSTQFVYHMTSVTFTDELRRAFARLKMLSERTGKQIRITAYRFRHTLGTNSIREGLGPKVTAKRLGHRSTTCVRAYVDVARAFELHDRIDLATAGRLGGLAEAFKGKLILREDDKDKCDSTHIVHPAVDENMQPVGDCKSNPICTFNKPVACYTCHLFRAWLDGPHEAMFAYLKSKRSNMLGSGCSDQIITIHDRTLTAVAQVIGECKIEVQRREALE